ENTGTQWFAKETAYWQKVEDTNISPLPVDRKSGTDEADGTGGVPKQKDNEKVKVLLTKEETEALLKNVNHAYNTEINDLLLTALGRTISRWTGEGRVLINLEGHGRETLLENVEVSRTVGWFTGKYPVILTMSQPVSGSESPDNNLSLDIRQTKENLRNIPNKGIGYGILKYLTPGKHELNLQKEQTSGRLPLTGEKSHTLQTGVGAFPPEIIFNYLGQFDRDIDERLFVLSGLSSGASVSPDSEITHKLSIDGLIVNGRLAFDFTYSKTHYHKETILKLAGSFKKNLRVIIEHCLDKKETGLTPGDYWPGILSISQLEELEKTMLPGEGEQTPGFEQVYPLSPM
ncbi:MAG: hypothetical protein GY757_56465, partial [bacterium]|nr:hypothetical protein [bacterium]